MPFSAMMRGHRQAMATGTANTVSMAKYFPSTTAVTDTGAVSSSWSVLVWRSSAMERMVRMGTTTMKMKREEPREREK